MNNQINIKHVCFDMDGTLVDSFNTIYKATIKTLDHMNIKYILDEKEFYKRIGQHFSDIFRELNISVSDIEQFINIFKGYYFNYIEESIPYASVVEVLKYLKENNIATSLLTTKAQDQADKIIELFDFGQYFDYVMGRRQGLAVKPSADPLLLICKELNVKPEETMMTGDSELDIRCGKNAGAFTCAAAYGYRTMEEIIPEKPDYIIQDIKDIIGLVK